MKKAIIVILCIIVTATLSIGLCFATNSFKDWNPNNWGNNIKDNINGSSVKECVLKSEKYGNFTIPKQNMFVNLYNYVSYNGNSNYYIANNTNLSTLYDAFKKDIVDIKDKDVEIFVEVGASNYNGYKTAEENLAMYEYKDVYTCQEYSENVYLINFENNILKFDEFKMIESVGLKEGLIKFVYVERNNIQENIDRSNVKVIGSSELMDLAVRVLAEKLTIEAEEENFTMYYPVLIKSDKGHIMTDSVYEEIKAEYEARGEKFPE